MDYAPRLRLHRLPLPYRFESIQRLFESSITESPLVPPRRQRLTATDPLEGAFAEPFADRPRAIATWNYGDSALNRLGRGNFDALNLDVRILLVS